MNTKSASFILPCAYILLSKREGGGKEATDFISTTQEIDLNSPNFSPGGADLLQPSKY